MMRWSKIAKNDYLKKKESSSCVWTTNHCFKTIRQSVLHVFQSLLWQVCLLFHAILLQQGCPIAGATATGHGGRGWGRQRGPRQGRWSHCPHWSTSSSSTWSTIFCILFRSSPQKENKRPAGPFARRRTSCPNRRPPSNCDTCRSICSSKSEIRNLKSSSSSLFSTFQTLNSISAEKNSTIIFPVPIDIIQSFISPSLPPTPTPPAAAAATSIAAAKKFAWSFFFRFCRKYSFYQRRFFSVLSVSN